MTRTVTVGLVGAGRIGRLHAEHLAYRIPQAQLVAVSDIILEAAQQCAAGLGIPTATQDHRVIMEDPDIEARTRMTTLCSPPTARALPADRVQKSRLALQQAHHERLLRTNLPPQVRKAVRRSKSYLPWLGR